MERKKLVSLIIDIAQGLDQGRFTLDIAMLRAESLADLVCDVDSSDKKVRGYSVSLLYRNEKETQMMAIISDRETEEEALADSLIFHKQTVVKNNLRLAGYMVLPFY